MRLLSPNAGTPDISTDEKGMREDVEEDDEEEVGRNSRSWKEIGMLKRNNSGYESLDSKTWDAKATGVEADTDDDNDNDELDLGLAARVRNVV